MVESESWLLMEREPGVWGYTTGGWRVVRVPARRMTMAGYEIVESCGGCGGGMDWETGVLAPFIRWYVFGELVPREIRSGVCRTCGMGGFDFRLGPEAIGRLYRGYRGEEYTRRRTEVEPGYGLIAKSLADYEGGVTAERKGLIDEFLRGENGGVLDYGGDRGQFIPGWFERKGVYDLSGVEPIEGVDRVEVEGTWDLVMCCQTLEHVPYLHEFLVGLRPHGRRFYFEVPLEPWDRVGGVPQLHEHCNFFFHDGILPKVLAGAGYGIEKSRVVAVDCGYHHAAFQQVLAVGEPLAPVA